MGEGQDSSEAPSPPVFLFSGSGLASGSGRKGKGREEKGHVGKVGEGRLGNGSVGKVLVL